MVGLYLWLLKTLNIIEILMGLHTDWIRNFEVNAVMLQWFRPTRSLYIVYSTRPPPQQLPSTWTLGYFHSSPHLHCEAIKVVHFSLTPVTFTWSTNRRNRSPSLTLIAIHVVCTTLPALTFHLFWWSGISHEVSKQLTVGFHAIVLYTTSYNLL